MLLSFEQVGKSYDRGGREGVVFDPFDLEINAGDLVGVWGERRSGKTTLLRLAAGIERPDTGLVRFNGRDLATMSQDDHSKLLLREIGMVTTPTEAGAVHADRSAEVIDQVALPLIFAGLSRSEAAKAARRCLQMVGAADCMHAAPYELKAGESTRVALARALVREPRLLLVDEPAVTHSPGERESIRELLHELSGELKLAMIVASEEVSMVAGAPRILSVGDGQVMSSERQGTVVPFPEARSLGGESSRS